MDFTEMTHDEMLERLRSVTQERDGLREQLATARSEAAMLRRELLRFRAAANAAREKAEQERDGLREQLEGWKKVAQEAEKVSDLALTNQEAAILGRVSAEKALDSMRSEAAMRQREHASLLADANAARCKAEQERDQANERAANLAVELAAMTLNRDQARQEADTLRRQVRVLAHAYAGAADCTRCKGKPLCSNLMIRPMPCDGVITAWAAKQAKEGGK